MPVRIKREHYDRASKVVSKLKPAVTLQALINEMIRESLPAWEKKAAGNFYR